MGEQLDRLKGLYDTYVVDPSFVSLRNKPGSNFIGGSGPLNPELMLIGESPGHSENTQGRPFVGKSGEELSILLKASTEINPLNVFLTCLVKYLSPIKSDKVLNTSFSYLKREIEIVNPIVVGLCGLNVIKMFYPDISEIIPYNGRLLDGRYVPLYSPGALIHTPSRRSVIRKGYRDLKQYITTKEIA